MKGGGGGRRGSEGCRLEAGLNRHKSEVAIT